MKKMLSILAMSCIITALAGCSPKQKPAKLGTSGLKSGKHCYVATFEKDSASLTLDIDTDGKLKGTLNVNYYNADTVAKNREPTAGELGGQFKGDTLLADYSFTAGKNKDAKYINPIALLHKGDTLIMGHGAMYYYLGRAYLDPKVPVIYGNSKFRFVPVDCK